MNLPFEEDHWLEVNINGETLSPGYRIASAGYTYTAKNLALGAKASGGIQLADDTSACTSANAGTLHRTGEGRLEICEGNSWKAIWARQDGTSQEQAGLSCKTILDEGYSTGDGVYWIKPTDTSFQVYCDMETNGGGYTLVVGIDGTNNNHVNTAAVTSENLISPTEKGKLSDTRSISLKAGAVLLTVSPAHLSPDISRPLAHSRRPPPRAEHARQRHTHTRQKAMGQPNTPKQASLH